MILISPWQDSLKTVELLKGPCSGINGLVSSFVRLLQVDTGACMSPISFKISVKSVRLVEKHDSCVVHHSWEDLWV